MLCLTLNIITLVRLFKLGSFKLYVNLYICFRSGKSCPFVLVKEELTMLARRAGRFEVGGFNYGAKNAPGFWPYPCPRPRFRMGWEYRLNNGTT